MSPTDPAVLFIPGLLETAEIWQNSMDRLNRHGLRSAAINLPGHTPRETQADVIAALTKTDWLDRIGRSLPDGRESKGTVLVGHSTGGMVALLLAHRFPERVHSVIALGALTGGHRDRRIDPIARLVTNKVLGPTAFRIAMHLWLSTPGRFRLGIRWASRKSKGLAIPDAVRRKLRACDPMALRACAKWVIETDISTVLPNIETPILALIGTEDTVVPPRHQISLIARAPKAHAQLIDGGHLLFAEAPDKLNAVLRSWIPQPSITQRRHQP
jgi:pimeloyl-ACP methyl ester carboxylesterase